MTQPAFAALLWKLGDGKLQEVEEGTGVAQ